VDVSIEVSTWFWIAGVFTIIKLIFKYLSWLYFDKDEVFRDSVQRAWDYVSGHSYFEIVKAVFRRLYARIELIFHKRMRFVYLFAILLLVNLASLQLAESIAGSEISSLKKLISLYSEHKNNPSIGPIEENLSLAREILFALQLTMIDLGSLLFTIGIIQLASRSTNKLILTAEVMTDICVVVAILWVSLQCLFYWLTKGFRISLYGAFDSSLFFLFFVWLWYTVFVLFIRFRCTEVKHVKWFAIKNTFGPLWSILSVFILAVLIIHMVSLITGDWSKASAWLGFFGFVLLPLMPVLLFWALRLGRYPGKGLVRFMIGLFFTMGVGGFVAGIASVIYAFSLDLSVMIFLPFKSSFIAILAVSSALPTVAHLIGIFVALLAKLAPKQFQQFTYRHVYAISKSNTRVLNQLGTACGGIGAFITAIVKLF